VSLLLLLEEVVEVATQQQHHPQHVLGHAGAHGALQVGQQKMTLAHQGLLHAAFDAGGRPLDPLQLLRLRQHLGRAHADRGIGGGNLARRGGGDVDELRARGHLLKHRQQIMLLLVDQDDSRRPPAGALAYRLWSDVQAELLDQLGGGCALRGRFLSADRARGREERTQTQGRGGRQSHAGPDEHDGLSCRGRAVYAMPPLTEMTCAVR